MNSRVTACEGKSAFKSRQTAERVARAMNAPRRAQNRRQTGHAPARVYRCPYCDEYHITGRKSVKIEVKEG